MPGLGPTVSNADTSSVFSLLALVTDGEATKQRLADLAAATKVHEVVRDEARAAIDQAAKDRTAADTATAEVARKRVELEAAGIVQEQRATAQQAALVAREAAVTEREAAATKLEQKNALDRQAIDDTIARLKTLTG